MFATDTYEYTNRLDIIWNVSSTEKKNPTTIPL